MALGLDLSGSIAKIARARKHLDSAEGIHSSFIKENKHYTICATIPNDATNGWCSIFLVGPHKVSEPLFGLIVGDCIHNLRCALDYIVVALVGASPGARLTDKHQFPIFDRESGYRRRVGTETTANPDGYLHGVTVGLKEIWALQPFHTKPNVIHALSCLGRFSNADKHRILSTDMHLPGPGSGTIETDGQIIEVWENPDRVVLGTKGYDEKFEVARFRFAKPYPKKIRFNAKITVDILVGTPAFGQYESGLALTPAHFYDICDALTKIVEVFKAL